MADQLKPPYPLSSGEKPKHAFGKRHRTRGKQTVMFLESTERRFCNYCGVEKPYSQFHMFKGKPRAKCKKCVSEHRKAEGGKANRVWWLKNRYGISLEIYDRMRAEQEYRCAVCRRHEDELKQDPSLGKNRCLEVDHCHKKGKGAVRGLLCNACNLSLGRLKDNPAIAFRAFLYLQDWAEREKEIGKAA